ncbi:hypothetical protein PHJA_000523000 [Phtheirospermum japonicum]|uniref:DUF7036 domain-containing protein n=1 Tax=Phtheirospermum japonicum TaxID=374723 RepID=A0A830BIT2_9LAMI|nr:hypothetical protein PHJA_000523000 [Phtheirospermum japonicum]
MGKAEDLKPLPCTALDAQGTTPNARGSNGCCLSCSWPKKVVTIRCAVALVLSVAVLLSAVSWLPFFHSGDNKNMNLDYAGHDVVACFMLKKPASFLKDHILQLEDDILDEISFSSTKVEIISLEALHGSNITKVVFAVEADVTTQSLIRAAFVSLITKQSSLRLSESLFGDPCSFDVLKFRGGISVSPNLYLRLTNLKGSTLAPPTTVKSQVLLAVGINPSKSRLKQLAQTITGSHSKNLGLNNTVFGRVKQVRLSSILQHSLNSKANSPLPSPSPSPKSSDGSVYIGIGSPASAPTPLPAPAPRRNQAAEPPCHFGYDFKYFPPYVPPVYAPGTAPSHPKQKHNLAPKLSPVPAVSPSRDMDFGRGGPPSRGEYYHARPPDVMPLISPSFSPCEFILPKAFSFLLSY